MSDPNMDEAATNHEDQLGDRNLPGSPQARIVTGTSVAGEPLDGEELQELDDESESNR